MLCKRVCSYLVTVLRQEAAVRRRARRSPTYNSEAFNLALDEGRPICLHLRPPPPPPPRAQINYTAVTLMGDLQTNNQLHL